MIKYHCGVLAAACAAVFSSFAGTSADIQALIDAAGPGATVTIPSGTYLLETPVTIGKAITLAGNSSDRTAVVLDGQGSVNCLEVTAAATIRDLTVQNGAGGKTVGSVICGAGVYAIGATIDNCIIRGCALNNEDTKFVTDGAGLYLNGGTVRGCLFSENVNTGCGSVAGNEYTGHKIRGGGVYATGTATFSNCRFVSNRVVNNNKGGRADNGVGGAGCFDGAGIVVENCSFEGNFATCWGGALCGQGITLRNSTFTGNSHGSPNYVRGGAAAVDGARVSGCVFEGQETTTGSDGTGEGLSAFGASVVTDCIFRNNSYNRGGAFGSSSGSPVVSNCVFEANTCTDRGGAISLTGVTSAQIVDCWVVDMTCAYYGSAIYLMNGAKAVTVRNCWFLRNSKAGGYAISLYNSAANAVTIENCSFVKNACGGVVYDASGNAIANIKVKNVLAYGNDYTSTKPFGAHADFATNGNIAFVASDDMTNLDLSDASGNVNLGETEPKNIFRDSYSDPANYALAPVSPAKDAGTEDVPVWAGDETLDMGTGEYAVTAVADYGVKIDRVGAKPRVVNGRIDIGAAEYAYEQGDEDWNKEPTEPYTPGETLPVFENGSDRIAAAIEQTASGERVAVPKGVYRMSGAVELARTDIAGFRSLANHPGAVVLDFQGQSAGIYSAEPIEVRGVTISNAVGGVSVSVVDYDGNGGAIGTTKAGAGICLTSAQSLITNCVVRNCSVVSGTTAVHGGGIFSAGKVVNTTVSGCSIEAKTLNLVAHGGGIFLTKGAVGVNLTVADCEVRATMYDVNARGTAGGGALGLCQATVEGGVFSGSVVTNIHTEGRIEGYGGGVTLYGGELRNCLVSNNWTHAGGGGVWARSDALVENCTIVDNELKKYFLATGADKDSGYAAGAGLGLMNSATARGCRIARNASDHGNDRAPGSGAVSLGNSAKLLDCVIEENPGANSVICGISDIRINSAQVSNCVIRANTYGKVNRGSLFLPFFAENGTLTVVDSFICGNKGENAKNPSVLLMTMNVGTTGTTIFRNSLIAGNSHSSACPLICYNNESSKVEFDNCTVVGNKMNAVEDTTAAWGTDFTCANTVFYNNTNGTAKAGFSANAVAQVTTTAADNPANLTFDETTGNIDLSATDPKFTDPANGVYALKSSSPLRDKGVAGDWAKVEGCTDLGDGTYTIAAALDWGVTVTGNNKHPRTGVKKAVGVIDIGACEYYHAPGLMLILR